MRNFTINSLLIHDVTQSIENVGYQLFTPVEGLDFPAIRLASQDRPGEHGALVPNQLYGGRVVSLKGKAYTPDIATYNLNRRKLEAAVRIVKNNYISLALTCLVTTDDGLALQFDAYAQRFSMPDMVLNHADFFIALFAPDPNLYNQSTSGITVAKAATVNATNNGDANTWITVTFTGALTNPIMTNHATGETFKLNYALGGGDVVVVDMNAKTIILNGTTNLNSAFDTANTWLSLVPGTNGIELEADSGSGHITVSYRDSFIGV